MHILHSNEILDWYHNRGVEAKVSDMGLQLLSPVIDDYEDSEKFEISPDGKIKPFEDFIQELHPAVQRWDECLITFTLWGIWPSTEDWPEFYNWRGTMGSKFSLEEAPGHLFSSDEKKELSELCSKFFRYGWEGYILFSFAGVAHSIVFVSHDGWVRLYTNLAD